jgi:hypothetical protein
MNNKRKTTINNLKSSNRGVALVSVLIALTVCLLVATVVLEITYTSLLSRKVNKYSNDNFYSSETALDDVETVLQNVAVYTMNQLKTESSTEFIESAASTLLASSGATSLNDTDAISQYLFSQLTDETKAVLGKQTEALDGTTTYEYDSSKFKITTVEKDITTSSSSKSTLTFSVELNYIDPDTNYETRIATDLIMNDVTHRTPAASYSIGSYSMFTGGGATFTGNDSTTSLSCFIQEGNAYIGMMTDSAPTALNITGQTSVIFDGNRIIINGDVYVKNGTLIFAGDKVDDTRTEVDIRGTLYIYNDAAVVLSDGVDLMVKDIKYIDSSGNKSSVFTDGKSYINTLTTTKYTDCLYPYTVDNVEALKTMSETTVVKDWTDSKTKGCILGYNKDTGVSQVIAYNSTDKNWYYVDKKTTTTNNDDGTTTESTDFVLGAKFDGLINHSDYFMPEALATVWTCDDTQENVDAEMCHFVNMDVLYWQKLYGNGNVIDYSRAQSIKALAGGSSASTSAGTVGYESPSGYTFDVRLVDGITTSLLKANSDSIKNVTGDYYNSIVSGKTVKGKTLTGATIFIGSNGGFVVNDSVGKNSLALTVAWTAYGFGMNSGQFTGLNLSASKIAFSVNGKGAVTSYSILGANDDYTDQTSNDLVDLINELKYLTFFDINSYFDTKGNGATWYTETGGTSGSWEDFYALGSIDSLFVGGLDAFFSTDDTSNAGGDITVNSSNMYNFITVENWQTN